MMFLFNGLFGLMSTIKYKDKCLLIDDLFGLLDEQKKEMLLKSLIESKIQIITTARNEEMVGLDMSKVNVIGSGGFGFESKNK